MPQEEPKPEEELNKIEPEIIDAFAMLGFNAEDIPELKEVKSKYRALLKKHHPDLKGATKEAHQYIQKLNHSMDLVAKFLANNEITY